MAMVAPPRAVSMIYPSDTGVIRTRVSRAVISSIATAPILMFVACSYCLLATAKSIRTLASDMSISFALKAGER